MIRKVVLAARARKQLHKLPGYISRKLLAWTLSVEKHGLEEVRKLPGFHDEPLRGKRKGQRSIRLSRSYRALYEVQRDGGIKFVSVEEVNKHEY